MLEQFLSLQGRWTFFRIIAHHDPKAIYTVRGSSSFTQIKEPFSFLYKEEGVLKTPEGASLNASQTYLYRYEKEGISVYFHEAIPRFFHRLKFTEQKNVAATNVHLCGEDQYEATYEFTSPTQFTLTYYVVGPKKSYTSATTFQKES